MMNRNVCYGMTCRWDINLTTWRGKEYRCKLLLKIHNRGPDFPDLYHIIPEIQIKRFNIYKLSENYHSISPVSLHFSVMNGILEILFSKKWLFQQYRIITMAMRLFVIFLKYFLKNILKFNAISVANFQIKLISWRILMHVLTIFIYSYNLYGAFGHYGNNRCSYSNCKLYQWFRYANTLLGNCISSDSHCCTYHPRDRMDIGTCFRKSYFTGPW